MARILSASPLVAAERRVDEIFEEVGGENGGAIDQGPGRPGTRNASEHRLVLARDERPVDLGPSEAAAPAARHRDLRDFRVAPQTEERRGAQVRGDRLSSAGEARHHERPLRSRDGPGTDVDAAGRGALPHAGLQAGVNPGPGDPQIESLAPGDRTVLPFGEPVGGPFRGRPLAPP